jgi:lipid-binding SYLF domain-containing protein
MSQRNLPVLVCLLLLLLFIASPASAQSRQDGVVRTATSVINEIMAIPASRIPQSLLGSAQGVAIIPSVVKVGLIGGVRHGRGVLVVRDEQGGWVAPQFITLTGGSIGWQIGVQSTDVVLVFKTQKSVANLSRGKFTIGVDAAAAAGPVGRNAAAATDAQLKAEILSYSRSRGLFVGVSLDGSSLQIDQAANAAFYYPAGYNPYAPPEAQGAVVPQSAIDLVATVSQLSMPGGGAVAVAQPAPQPAVNAAPPALALPAQAGYPGTSTAHLQQQLADSALRLNTLLDENWRQFLALPAEIFTGTTAPSAQSIEAAMIKYDQVASSPQFRTLAMRHEFQATHDLLQKYAASQAQYTPGSLMLPPPPTPATSGLDTRQR